APHVVISAIGLPGMDGHELARKIRNASGGAGILLVALTGSSDRETLADPHFDHTPVKPVELALLERLLQNGTRSLPPSDSPIVATPGCAGESPASRSPRRSRWRPRCRSPSAGSRVWWTATVPSRWPTSTST